MIFSCITLTILSPSSGLAVKDYIYAHKNFKCRRRDKPASNCKVTNNLSVIQTLGTLFSLIYDKLTQKGLMTNICLSYDLYHISVIFWSSHRNFARYACFNRSTAEEKFIFSSPFTSCVIGHFA